MSVFVCLSVCQSARVSQKPYGTDGTRGTRPIQLWRTRGPGELGPIQFSVTAISRLARRVTSETVHQLPECTGKASGFK